MTELFNLTVDTTPDIKDNIAMARLYGEPLFDIPNDLYIPPDALEVFLESFEGPLDLLLYLIRKQNFNVLDIPMAEVTDQYLSYVEQIRHHNLELAADYLLMAGMLIAIKSRMLLPIKKNVDDDQEDDPRAELVRRLLEYERIKLAAQKLDQLPREGRDFTVAKAKANYEVANLLPEINAEDLKQAWHALLKRAQLNKNHQVTKEQLSVRAHMSAILKRLQDVPYLEFTVLFQERINTGEPVAVIVVHFLAMLELTRESLLEITQAEAYAPIYVRLSFHSHQATLPEQK